MNERYVKLQMEAIVNKLLYQKKVIQKNMFEETAVKIDKQIWDEHKK